jgi:hypothetical protein
MLAHVDDAEEATHAPVVSVSLGCDGIFLLGGPTRDSSESPVLPILLRSGDVLLLGGRARLCYHAMARVFPRTAPAHLFPTHAPTIAAQRHVASAATPAAGHADNAPRGGRTAAAAQRDCAGVRSDLPAMAPAAARARLLLGGDGEAADAEGTGLGDGWPELTAEEREWIAIHRINLNIRQVKP